MSNGKKILTFTFIAVIGSLALMAPGAGAKNQLVIEGKVLPEGKLAKMEATGGKYVSSVPALGIKLKCATAELLLTTKNQASGAVGSGSVLAHECTFDGFEEVCESHSVGQPPGLIQAFGGSLQVQSLSTNRYLVTTASASIEHLGEECPLAELTVQVSGTAAFSFSEPFTEATTHTMADITSKEESELKVSVFYGKDPLYIEGGEATGHLTGEFEGMKFSLN